MRDLNYFKKYMIYKKQLEICNYELRHAKGVDNTSLIREIENLESHMAEIKAELDSYPVNDEKLFLRCRYLDGLTMEETAEMMHISRNTAYRLKRKIVDQIERLS